MKPLFRQPYFLPFIFLLSATADAKDVYRHEDTQRDVFKCERFFDGTIRVWDNDTIFTDYPLTEITMFSAPEHQCFHYDDKFPEFEAASKAYMDYDRETAFSIFEDLAERANLDAQIYLGYMYEHGKGPVDVASLKDAAQWYQRAADGGHIGGKVALATLILSDNPDEKAEAKAFNYLTQASQQGSGPGRYHLGMMYYDGDHVGKDKQKALDLIEQSTRLDGWMGDIVGGATIGEAMWQSKYLQESENLKPNYTPELIAAMEAETVRRKNGIIERDAELRELGVIDVAEMAAEAGPVGQGFMAYHAQDYDRAFPIIRAHARNGDVEAQTILGIMYRDGLGVDISPNTALDWFAKADTGESNYLIAIMAINGQVEIPTHFKSPYLANARAYMDRAVTQDYGPAVEFMNKYNAQKQKNLRDQELRRQAVQQELAEAEARRQAHIEKYGRDDEYDSSTCKNPRRPVRRSHTGQYVETGGDIICD